MDKEKQKKLENPGDLEIFYNKREVKISELTDDEKIDCIARLWLYKGLLEDELEKGKEMVQKMYLFGKMEKLEEEEN